MDANDPRILRQLKKNEKRTRAGLKKTWQARQDTGPGQERSRELVAQEEKGGEELQLAKERRQLLIMHRLGIRTAEELATVLWKAVEDGDGELMVECVLAGADVHALYPVVDGNPGVNATVLHVAARNNRTALIPRLVAMGAVVDARTAWDATPLMTAAHRGSTAAAVQLVAAGADLWALNQNNQTAAELAESYAFDWRIALWLRDIMAWKERGSLGVPPRPFEPGEYPLPGGGLRLTTHNVRTWTAPGSQPQDPELDAFLEKEPHNLPERDDEWDPVQAPAGGYLKAGPS